MEPDILKDFFDFDFRGPKTKRGYGGDSRQVSNKYRKAVVAGRYKVSYCLQDKYNLTAIYYVDAMNGSPRLSVSKTFIFTGPLVFNDFGQLVEDVKVVLVENGIELKAQRLSSVLEQHPEAIESVYIYLKDMYAEVRKDERINEALNDTAAFFIVRDGSTGWIQH